jgi:hypothetical protein
MRTTGVFENFLLKGTSGPLHVRRFKVTKQNKQNKTKQNKTKQNKTKQNKTKQDKTKQNKAKQNKTKQKLFNSSTQNLWQL